LLDLTRQNVALLDVLGRLQGCGARKKLIKMEPRRKAKGQGSIPSDKQVILLSKPASPTRSLSLSIPVLEVLPGARYTVGSVSTGGKAFASTS
jgi:hypothetical protein